MITTAPLLLLLIFPPSTVSVEERVLKAVEEVVEDGRRINFSELYNSDRFSGEEKAFLGRLYETFFQIPGFLKSEYVSTGETPTLQHIASGFGIGVEAVDLLLRVMETDPRIPRLFRRRPEGGELESLDTAAIRAFIDGMGSQVRLVDWEGRLLPDFRVEGFDGVAFGPERLKGRPTLVYFWFTGCPPCVRIAPSLVDLQQRFSDRGFQVLALNADRLLGLDVSDEARLGYLQRLEADFVNAHLDAETRAAFGSVNVYPTLFFVGPDLRVVRHMLNYQDAEILHRAVEEMIGD